MTIEKAAQYVSKPIFGPKKAKLDLPGHFDGKVMALNTWLFEIKQNYLIVGLNKSTDLVKLAICHLGKDVHMWWK